MNNKKVFETIDNEIRRLKNELIRLRKVKRSLRTQDRSSSYFALQGDSYV
ncbi:MAG: hypothetical protein ACTSQE_02605 [Candidatus Heimdallarchaeaceae archaeon]